MHFRSPDQKQARCIARHLVVQAADMLGVSGKFLDLERNSRGRPFLAGTDLDVSFSHTPGLTVCAMSLGCRVGVDVELRRELQFEDIASALSGPEKTRVQSGNLPWSLLSCWTAKEAVLKGDGRGFGPGLEAQDLFSPEPVLDGVRWYVSRHVLEHGATTYLYALATDVSDALVKKGMGKIIGFGS
jgi:4'-phosphopantetheinyl transferase